MKFLAQVTVMPLAELLDPQGKAVNSSLHNLGLNEIEEVRIGKHITLNINAADANTAKAIAEDACKKLLHNAVMERFDVQVQPLS